MHKYKILFLMILLPALLAACFPAAGLGATAQPSPTGVATLSPALTPALAPAGEKAVPPGSAGPTPGTGASPISATPAVSGTVPAPEEAATTSALTPAATAGPPPVVTTAIAGAARQLGLSPNALALISYEAINWPDSCLGLAVPGLMCAQVITPGYRIVLRGPHGEFEVHTGAAGMPARVVPPGAGAGLTAPAPTAPPAAPPAAVAPSATGSRPATLAPARASGASGIEGVVTIGPITPVARKGQANSRPYQAMIDVLDQSGQLVTRFLTNAQGLYRVALAPGSYVIRPEFGRPFPAGRATNGACCQGNIRQGRHRVRQRHPLIGNPPGGQGEGRDASAPASRPASGSGRPASPGFPVWRPGAV